MIPLCFVPGPADVIAGYEQADTSIHGQCKPSRFSFIVLKPKSVIYREARVPAPWRNRTVIGDVVALRGSIDLDRQTAWWKHCRVDSFAQIHQQMTSLVSDTSSV